MTCITLHSDTFVMFECIHLYLIREWCPRPCRHSHGCIQCAFTYLDLRQCIRLWMYSWRIRLSMVTNTLEYIWSWIHSGELGWMHAVCIHPAECISSVIFEYYRLLNASEWSWIVSTTECVVIEYIKNWKHMNKNTLSTEGITIYMNTWIHVECSCCECSYFEWIRIECIFLNTHWMTANALVNKPHRIRK